MLSKSKLPFSLHGRPMNYLDSSLLDSQRCSCHRRGNADPNIWQVNTDSSAQLITACDTNVCLANENINCNVQKSKQWLRQIQFWELTNPSVVEEEIQVLRGVGTSAQLGAPRATKPPPALRQAPTRANPPTLSGENIIISAASLCHHAFNGDLSSHYHEIWGRWKKEIFTGGKIYKYKSGRPRRPEKGQKWKTYKEN